MAFWNKKDRPSSDVDMFGTIFDDDQEFTPYVPPAKAPVELDDLVLEALEAIRSDCELIKSEESPAWPKFFKNLEILESNWPDIIDADEASCPCFADELFDEEDLVSVEWIFNDSKFLNGIAKFINAEVHFVCWLLTSEHRNNLKPAFLNKLLEAIIDSEMGDDCEECAQNGWWGSPLTYLAENDNSSAVLLQSIYDEVGESDNTAALGTLALNPKTPKAILKKLALDDRKVIKFQDEMSPCFDVASRHDFQISRMANANLDQ